MKKLFFLLFQILALNLLAQDTLLKVIQLDDVIISEDNNGFTVEDFIHYVKNDTTFYKGFKHLRYYQHKYSSSLNIYNKKNKKIGVLNKKGTHFSDGERAFVVDDSLYVEGKIFKRNGSHKYYTTEAFDEVFFPYDSINVSLEINKNKDKEENQNVRDAKTIGFSIGTDNVEQSKGGAKKKLAIFDVDMHAFDSA